MIIPWN